MSKKKKQVKTKTEEKQEKNVIQKNTDENFLQKNSARLFQKIVDNKKTIIILLTIFFLAMAMRSNIVRFEGNYLFEPDAYYHARLVQEIVEQGHINKIDPNVYYFFEGGMPHFAPELQHYLIVLIYYILSVITLQFGAYSKELVVFAAQIAPIFFGALITISTYFLAKEIFNNKKIAYITAFLTAITPAFVYRTMAGAEGSDSSGFIWMVLGLIFLVRALKTNSLDRKDLINSAIGGIFFGLMAITWRANILIPLILLPATIIMMLLVSGKPSVKKSFFESELFYLMTKIGVALLIYTIMSGIYGFFAEGYTSIWILALFGRISEVIKIDSTILIIIATIVSLGFTGLCYYLSNAKKDVKKYALLLAITILYLGVIGMTMLMIIEPDFFYSGSGRQSIWSLVGEESLGNSSFPIKYNSLLVFPILAFVLFPISLYFFREEKNYLQVIPWFWAIITFFLAWYKLKFTFYFGLGLVMGAIITCYIIYELVKKYDLKGIEGRTILLATGFLLLIGLSGTSQYITQFEPLANSSPYWIETMDWIKTNTSEDAKFFNWWSDGHQLAFITERKFSVDNRNASAFGNSAYAEFNVTTNVNRGYEIMTKEIGAEYVILNADNFSSGPTFEFYVNNSVDPKLGQKYYDFSSRVINCVEISNGFVCGGQLIPREQFVGIGKKWKNNPNEFVNGETPVFYYAEEEQLTIIGPGYNNTNLAKIYFNSEETSELYEEVYSNQGLKIFRIK